MTKIKDATILDENMHISTIGDRSYRWLDPLNCEAIQILGFNWIETDKIYRRMPICKPGYLPEAVDSLALCCSGGQLKFRTNSTSLAIEAEFAHAPTMDHMPPTGQNGFDCYIGDCGSMQYATTARFDNKCSAYCVPFFTDIAQTERLFTINFPLYNGELKKLRIGIDPEATLSAPPTRPEHKIVVYGTSITQGGCASRPGMSFTNILSRMLNAEFINLGFSGNGRGEPPVIETLGSIDDMKLLIIDYEANTNSKIFDNLPAMVKQLRKQQPQLPLLIISRVGYGQENIRPQSRIDAGLRRDFQRDFVKQQQADGDNNIAFFDGTTFFAGKDPGEFAVDGCHLTDYGFMVMAEKLCPVIAKYLTK
jgi:lysophospholipase L1-like esterase